jgi:hypothetical protein
MKTGYTLNNNQESEMTELSFEQLQDVNGGGWWLAVRLALQPTMMGNGELSTDYSEQCTNIN